jgi:hypothetical protein
MISRNRELRRERVLKERQTSIDGTRVLRGGRVRDDCARVARAEIGRVLISDFGKPESDKMTQNIDCVCLREISLLTNYVSK